MPHMISVEGERMLDLVLPVLDRGHVIMVDYMGADARPAQVARVSTGVLAGRNMVRGEIISDADGRLTERLMHDRHTSPFEFVDFIFLCKLPIFVARQWVRHRTASINEWSGRYSVLPDEFYIPALKNVRKQGSMRNKQSSGDPVSEEDAQWFLNTLASDNALTYSHYEEALSRGISKEMSRLFVELNLYTTWYWKINLHNLLHFLGLRYATDAQPEIQEYAERLLQCAVAVAPTCVDAWEQTAPALYRGKTMEQLREAAK